MDRKMQATAAEIAELVQGTYEGPGDVVVKSITSVDRAVDGGLVLAENKKYFKRALDSKAVCILTGNGINAETGRKCIIRVDDPNSAFIKVLWHFKDSEGLPPVGIGPNVGVGKNVTLGSDIRVGANCILGDDAVIGDGCILFPNTYIGNGVKIGPECKIYTGVVVYQGCRIGRGVVLHAGVVIGADGFGYRPGTEALVRIPHIGTVIIEDDVEIGANSAVDRAKTGATVIGRGTKIDNLVHIAHNVRIGSNCIIIALSGVAGSVEIGNNVTLAAQSGVKDHVQIGDGAVIAARGGVIGDVPGGCIVSGFPARDHRAEMKMEAAKLHLPEILKRLRTVEEELKKLQKENGCGEAKHIDD